MPNWQVIETNIKNKIINLSDFPSDKEIFEKLIDVGMFNPDSNIISYEFNKDCSYIHIFDNYTGEFLFELEII